MSESIELKQRVEKAYRKNRKDFLAAAKMATRNILDAEDVVHEAFAKALSNLDVIRNVENLPAWLFTVVRNRIVDLWRRRRMKAAAGEVNVAEETISEIISSTGLDPSDETVRDALSSALSEAISALPGEQRAVINAQVFDNLTFRELAEKTGESMNTLATRKKMAVKKLAAALRGWITE
ncbi:MAG: sigma-70 family RNA polymerase sigma factor [Spirochaetales bacterium]|nr:sigma-70 family RNA polymerase sigma factor [Spirochaetales bacterium]